MTNGLIRHLFLSAKVMELRALIKDPHGTASLVSSQQQMSRTNVIMLWFAEITDIVDG